MVLSPLLTSPLPHHCIAYHKFPIFLQNKVMETPKKGEPWGYRDGLVLKALAALPEDPRSVGGTHAGWLSTSDPNCTESEAPFRGLLHPHKDTYMCT